jgi:hypothetical protein
VLLNYGAIETHPREFPPLYGWYYPEISIIMAKMDEERLEIGKAYGINLKDTR